MPPVLVPTDTLIIVVRNTDTLIRQVTISPSDTLIMTQITDTLIKDPRVVELTMNLN